MSLRFAFLAHGGPARREILDQLLNQDDFFPLLQAELSPERWRLNRFS